MACRCKEKEMYSNDIAVLETALKHAQKIIDDQISIDGSVDTMKEAYTKTVKGPDDLPTEFDNIHDGAIEAANAIKSEIETALQNAKDQYEAAVIEDEEYHASENSNG